MRISNLVSSGTALTALLWASVAGAYTTIDAETNASVYKVAGVATQGYAGQSIAPVGDVDGDGSGDFLVGVPGLSTVRGSAYLFYGPLTADTDLSENGAWWASFTRPCSSNGCDLVGSSVAGAGDVNGDGFDDLLIGAFNDGLGAGAVYLIYGGSRNIEGFTGVNRLVGEFDLTMVGDWDYGWDQQAVDYRLRGAKIVGRASGDKFGFAMAGGADFNADGLEDFAISAPFHDYSATAQDTGSVFVFAGTSELTLAGDLETSSDVYAVHMWSSSAAIGLAGYSLAWMGDINGDGKDDLAVGTPGYDVVPSGTDVGLIAGYTNLAALGPGGTVVLPGAPAFKVKGRAAGDLAGSSLAAGDFDDDGTIDLLVGAPGVDVIALPVKTDAGAAFIVEGPLTSLAAYTPLAASLGAEIQGVSAYDRVGTTVAASETHSCWGATAVVGAPVQNAAYSFYRERTYEPGFGYTYSPITGTGTVESMSRKKYVGPLGSSFGKTVSAGEGFSGGILIGAPSSMGAAYLVKKTSLICL